MPSPRSLPFFRGGGAFAAGDHRLVGARLSAAESRDAPVHRSDAKIRDAQGRTRFIVDLVADPTGKPSRFNTPEEKRAWYTARSARQIDDLVKLRGISVLGSTSLVGTSFIAYLDEKDVEHFAKDKQVALLTEDRYLTPSAVWNDSTDPGPGAQFRPWGLQALGMTGQRSNGTATVYILDTGVEPHADLTGLEARLTAQTTATNGQPVNPTGCNSHATHVAGIIGADINGLGVVGVLPGVKMVSIALGDVNYGTCPPGYSATSGSDGRPISSFVMGLDQVSWRVLQSGRVGIVNLSFNDPYPSPPRTLPNAISTFSTGATVGAKMAAVSTAIYEEGILYRGALIVQSGGNHNKGDACQVSYDDATPNNGILVVGGLEANGQRVVPIPGLGPTGNNGYVNEPLGGNEPGSNFGNCVKIFAPSQRIRSTWANGNLAYLSGTSMAAPHVSGFAAWVLENVPNIFTSHDLEAAVMQRARLIAGSNLMMPTLSNANLAAAPTLEIMEGDNRASWALPPNYMTFSKLPADIHLRYAAIGAGWCRVDTQRAGYAPEFQFRPANYQIEIDAGFPTGNYTWTVTCFSGYGTQTSLTVLGTVRRRISLNWYASRSYLPGGSPDWQWVANEADSGIFNWSAQSNDPFDQYYTSTGADSCEVTSFGFNGEPVGDPEFKRSTGGVSPLPFASNVLWNSTAGVGPWASVSSLPSPAFGYPPSYTFGTMYFGEPRNAPPPIFGPWDGYKWKVDCRNWEGERKYATMYGRPFR